MRTTATRHAPGGTGPAIGTPSRAAAPPPGLAPVPQPRLGGAPAGRPAGWLGSRVRARLARWLAESFRLPGRRDPAPHPARLIGICTWAAMLGLLGLPVAARSSIAIVSGAAPAWFEPTVVIVGALGIALTAAAFAAIHRRWLSWLLLAIATVPLATNLTLTVTL